SLQPIYSQKIHLYFHISLLLLPPTSTLFPYTTLFRSGRARPRQPRSDLPAQRAARGAPGDPPRGEPRTRPAQRRGARLLAQERRRGRLARHLPGRRPDVRALQGAWLPRLGPAPHVPPL